jgi:hypothetical protein
VTETGSPRDHVRTVAEAVADVLVERGLVVGAPEHVPRVLDALEVGRLIGRDRRWVYAHAEELGGFRYGNGPKARLGFDRAVVERWTRERQIASRRDRRTRNARPSSGLLREQGANLIPFDA